jgi:NADH-quinone oxidoreductase subunit A
VEHLERSTRKTPESFLSTPARDCHRTITTGLTPAKRKLTVEPEREKMPTPDYFWNYLPLLMQILVAVGFGAGIVTASWFIGRHRNSAVKLASYECGIPAEGDARGRFSVRFYMVAMLFILFDVEAVFMLPWAVVYRDLPKLVGSRMFGFWEMVVYLGFVLVGLFYVAKKGILDWSSDKADL